MTFYLSAPYEVGRISRDYHRVFALTYNMLSCHERIVECDNQECVIWYLNAVSNSGNSIPAITMIEFLKKHTVVLGNVEMLSMKRVWISKIKVQGYGASARVLHSVRLSTFSLHRWYSVKSVGISYGNIS